MTAFLREKMGYDALYLDAVIVVFCGVAVEALGFLVLQVFDNQLAGLRSLPAEGLLFLAAAAAYFLVTASLGYGLIFALCKSLVLGRGVTRVLALLAAPLGSILAAVASYQLLNTGEFGPDPLEMLSIAALASYAVLGLPLLVAAVLAVRKINKTRVNAEAVFGGSS